MGAAAAPPSLRHLLEPLRGPPFSAAVGVQLGLLTSELPIYHADPGQGRKGGSRFQPSGAVAGGMDRKSNKGGQSPVGEDLRPLACDVLWGPWEGGRGTFVLAAEGPEAVVTNGSL